MIIHDLKANTGFPDDGKLIDFIYSQIHFLISQLHQYRKFHLKQISQRL
jgi:hypothetical protein